MKRKSFAGALLALAMVFALTGCAGGQKDNAGAGTGTPTQQVTPSGTMPGTTGTPTPEGTGSTASARSISARSGRADYDYYATDRGMVTDPHHTGSELVDDTRRAVDRAGDAMRDTVDDAGRGIRDMADDLTR